MKTKELTIVFLFGLILLSFNQNESLYLGKGSVQFESIAPLETIKASSDELKGLINLEQKTFAFKFDVRTFEGFNSPLQKEHFNEYYLETKKYPYSTFSGNFIGLKDTISEKGDKLIAKGKFTIHGVTNLVSIPVVINSNPKDNSLTISSDFEVKLEDYKIYVPLVLQAKISPIINVNVKFTGKLKQ